jgi:hypothetical protein
MERLSVVRTKFYMTEAYLSKLKPFTFKSLPGIYLMIEANHKRRRLLVSLHRTILISGQNQDRPRPVEQMSNFMSSCALPYHDRQTGRVDHGMSCAGCQLTLQKGIFSFQHEPQGLEFRDKVYSQDGFLEHFKRCQQAQLLWISRREGTKKLADLPKFVRKGGLFAART